MTLRKIILGVFLLVFSITTVGYGQIQISIPDTTAKVGSTFSIPVYTEDLTDEGVLSYEVELSIDSSLIAYDTVNVEGTISEGSSMATNVDTSGHIHLSVANSSSFSGAGVLVELIFQLESTGNAKVEFESFVFNEGNPSADTVNGSVEVVDNSPPNSFSLVHPESNETIKTTTPTFEWEQAEDENPSDTVSYDIQVRHEDVVTINATTTDTTWQPDEELLDNSQYHWRVVASDGSSSTTNNNGFTEFTINTENEAPSTFNLLSPEDGETEVSQQPNLKWEQSIDVDPNDNVTYAGTLEAISSTLPAIKTFQAGQDTSHQVSNEFGEGSEWQWWVVAIGSDSLKTFSDTLTFTVRTETDIEGPKERPDEFSLEPAYPNPFNPTTQIKYALPKATYVNLTIYDLLGHKVRTLVNGNKQAGRYSVSFNAGNLSSGVYIYKIRTGSFTQSRKMMLLR